MDRLASVLLAAGLGCFALAFLLSGVYPWAITDAKHPEATIADLAEAVTAEFRQLKEQYPVEFAATYPRADEALSARELAALPADDARRARSEDAWRGAYAKAVRDGRDLYVAEACWHCHSQFVRPVANEEQRFGPVRDARHYDTALDRPVLWGTRRVGPDLTNEGGLRTNDWHAAHLHDPQSTSPDSVMPAYTWYFHEGWEVRRRVDPAAADRERLDPQRSYALPGLYATEGEARTALQRIADATPSALDGEKGRLFVAPGFGPTGEGLSLIAYLQWLGTWQPAEDPER
jgi:cytochrome c oxidase cbb3-type subunit II